MPSYTVTVSGYGAEIIMGAIPSETAKYLIDNDVDLDDMLTDYDNEVDVPEKYRYVKDGAWDDNDGLYHGCGALMDLSNIVVRDAAGNVIHQVDCTAVPSECTDETNTENIQHAIFRVVYDQKGEFIVGDLTLDTPFDPSKLSISYEVLDGDAFTCAVSYDGEELEDNGNAETMGTCLHADILNI